MRFNRGLVTGVAACLAVFFIILNLKSTIETVNNSGINIKEPYVGEQNIHKDQVNPVLQIRILHLKFNQVFDIVQLESEFSFRMTHRSSLGCALQ